MQGGKGARRTARGLALDRSSRDGFITGMRNLPDRSIALFVAAAALASIALFQTDATLSMGLTWAAGAAMCVGLRAIEDRLSGRNYTPGAEAEEPMVARPRQAALLPR